MVTVKQSGGDYSSLKAAVDANQTTISIEGTWSVDDDYTGSLVIDSSNATTITTDSDSKNLGYTHVGTGSWYRVRKTDTGHMFTLSDDITITGVDSMHEGATTSDEIFRISAGGCTIIADCCGFGYDAVETGNQSDVVMHNSSPGLVNHVWTQCFVFNASRAVFSFDGGAATSGTTVDVNSCAFWNNGNGAAKRWNAFFGCYGSDIVVSVFNCAIHTAHTGGSLFMISQSDTESAVIDRCLTQLGDWTVSQWNSETVTDSGLSYTWTTSLTPGAGDFVICNDLTGVPDLRLADDSDNDAQDAHADGSGAGLTMPSTDCAGTTRPVNTNYDIGHYEVPASGTNVDVPAIAATSAIVAPTMRRELAVPAVGASSGIVAPTVLQVTFVAVPAIGATSAIVAPTMERRIDVAAIPATSAIVAPTQTRSIPVPAVAASSGIVAPGLQRRLDVAAIGATSAIVAPGMSRRIAVGAITATSGIVAPTIGGAILVDVPAMGASSGIVAPTMRRELDVPAVAASSAIVAPTLQRLVDVPAISASSAIVAPTQVRYIDVAAIGATSAIIAPSVGGVTQVAVPAMGASSGIIAPTMRRELAVPAIAATSAIVAPGQARYLAVPAIAATSGIIAPGVQITIFVAVPAIGATATIVAPSVAVGAQAIVTVGNWSVPVTFAAGDSLLLTMDGGSLTDAEVRVVIALES